MKLLIFLTFLFISTVSVNSQILSNFGLKAGLGISNQSWDYKDDINLEFDNKVGIAPRVFFEFLDLSLFEMQAELGFLQKGFKEKVPIGSVTQPDGTGEFINVNNKLNYLSLSALAKLKYTIGVITPYIILGPQFNLLLSKEIDKGWEVVFDEFSKNNFGISVGIGSDVTNVFPFTFLIEYKYERDFIDNFDSPNINIKNYSHIFLVGIKL
jgi:opacity protein-like surface antigen